VKWNVPLEDIPFTEANIPLYQIRFFETPIRCALVKYLRAKAVYQLLVYVQVEFFESNSISDLQRKLNEFLRGIDEENFIDVKLETMTEIAPAKYKYIAIVVFTPKPDASYS
jgi:hypothetical protein